MDFDQLNILLVEDSDTDCQIIKRSLESHMRLPWALTHVRTIAEAEAILNAEEGQINLVLLDLGLPDTDGKIGTLLKLQSVCPYEIPILVLTGTDDSRPAVEMVAAGASDFIRKSYISKQPETLCLAIDLSICRFRKIEKM